MDKRICPPVSAGLTCCTVAPRCYTRVRSVETRVAICRDRKGLRARREGFGNGRRGPEYRRPRPCARLVAAAPRPAGSQPLLAPWARGGGEPRTTYAALDLGTNNCRLLVARPAGHGFRVIDAFSRIIRLGEGISASGRISEAAIERAVSALSVCRDKMRQRRAGRARLIATEACRAAENGDEFHARILSEVGPRSRDHRPQDRGRARRHRLHAADRSRHRGRHPVRHRRRLVRAGAARALRADAARAARAHHRGLGVDPARRGDARRAARRPRGHPRGVRGDGRRGDRADRRVRGASTAAISPACTCSAPPAP